jgi:hypothetical protein
MQVIRIEDLPLQKPSSTARGGLEYYRILEGKPGDPGNFMLLLSATLPGYYSPRHKHNFEQIRFKVDESASHYDDLGDAGKGSVGYFPEGTPYGPSSSSKRSQGLILQYGGPSGSGYMSRGEYQEHYDALCQKGTFEKGVYTWFDERGGKHNQDGYEAVWEHWTGRTLEYPKARYRSAIMMEPANVPWIATEDQSGVSHRQLGVFGSPGTTLEFFRLDPGARMTLSGRGIYFVSEGAGSHPSIWTKHTTFFLESGQSGEIEAGERSELLHIGMPDLGALRRLRPDYAIAAE